MPGAGTALIDGADVTRLPEPRRAGLRNRRIGSVFQMDNLRFLINGLVVAALCALVSVLPAQRAARIEVVEVLRHA